jgi:hypothetical protein
MTFNLVFRDGLYYCMSDIYTVAHNPTDAQLQCTVASTSLDIWRTPSKFTPTTKARQIESEVWMLRFGSPGKHQLKFLPWHVTGTPTVFEYHLFCYVDFKEQAYICKQAAQQTAKCIPMCGVEFYMDFGFLGSSTENYKRPNKATDRIVLSYDGYSSRLVMVDDAS